MVAAGAAVSVGAAAAAKAIAAATAAAAAAAKPSVVSPTVSANGYNFDTDGIGRPGKIYGQIRLDPAQKQSRRLQRDAGKPNREPSDDGGHYIAREFGGPNIPENHFPQNSTINRSDYRKLENKWKRAAKRGDKVDVVIVPKYNGPSKRPDSLEITYTINGRPSFREITNKPKGKGK